MKGKDALQWLYSNGAIVDHADELNPFMGQPWYEAAREVTRTLLHKIAGTHQDVSLVKGTNSKYRAFAKEFVEYMISKRILEKVVKSDTGPGWVVKVSKNHRHTIEAFGNHGEITQDIQPFFIKFLSDEAFQRVFCD